MFGVGHEEIALFGKQIGVFYNCLGYHREQVVLLL